MSQYKQNIFNKDKIKKEKVNVKIIWKYEAENVFIKGSWDEWKETL